MTNEITISKSLSGTTYKVTLGTVRMDKSFNKDVNYVKFPKATGSQVKNPADPLFGPTPIKSIDLLKIEQRYSIEGWIVEGGYTGDTSTGMTDAKNNLENMFLAGGVVTFNYDDETDVTGALERMQIEKRLDDNPTSHNTGETNYFVKLTIVKSIDFGQPDE